MDVYEVITNQNNKRKKTGSSNCDGRIISTTSSRIDRKFGITAQSSFSSTSVSAVSVSTSSNSRNCYEKDARLHHRHLYRPERTGTAVATATVATATVATRKERLAFTTASDASANDSMTLWSRIVDQIFAMIHQESTVYYGQIVDYYVLPTSSSDEQLLAGLLHHDRRGSCSCSSSGSRSGSGSGSGGKYTSQRSSSITGTTSTTSTTSTIYPNISIVSNDTSRDEDDIMNEMDRSNNTEITFCSNDASTYKKQQLQLQLQLQYNQSLRRFSSTSTMSGVSIDDVKNVESMQLQQQQQQKQQHIYANTLQSPRTVYHLQYDPTQSQQQQYQYPNPQTKYVYWRTQMYEWSCMVIDSYNIDYEVVCMSFNLLDRYMSNELFTEKANNTTGMHVPIITREDYQLFSMTCLYIAMKLVHGTTTASSCQSNRYMKISIETFVQMSNNYYSKDDIETTECDILQSLNWYLHAPTSISYLRLLLQLLPKSIQSILEPTANILLKITTLKSYFCTKKSMDIALSVLYHAIQLHSSTGSMDRSESYYNITQLLHTCDPELHHLLVMKNNCPEFRRLHIQLMKYYLEVTIP